MSLLRTISRVALLTLIGVIGLTSFSQTVSAQTIGHSFVMKLPDGSAIDLKGSEAHSTFYKKASASGHIFMYDNCNYSTSPSNDDKAGQDWTSDCYTHASCDATSWVSPYLPSNFNTAYQQINSHNNLKFTDVLPANLRPLFIEGNPRGFAGAKWVGTVKTVAVCNPDSAAGCIATDSQQFKIVGYQVPSQTEGIWGNDNNLAQIPDNQKTPLDQAWSSGVNANDALRINQDGRTQEMLLDRIGGNILHGQVVWSLDLAPTVDAQCLGFNSYKGPNTDAANKLAPVAGVGKNDIVTVAHANKGGAGLPAKQRICWAPNGLTSEEYANADGKTFTCQFTSPDSAKNAITGVNVKCDAATADSQRCEISATMPAYIAALQTDAMKSKATQNGLVFIQGVWPTGDTAGTNVCTTNPSKGLAGESGWIFPSGVISPTQCGMAKTNGATVAEQNCIRRVNFAAATVETPQCLGFNTYKGSVSDANKLNPVATAAETDTIVVAQANSGGSNYPAMQRICWGPDKLTTAEYQKGLSTFACLFTMIAPAATGAPLPNPIPKNGVILTNDANGNVVETDAGTAGISVACDAPDAAKKSVRCTVTGKLSNFFNTLPAAMKTKGRTNGLFYIQGAWPANDYMNTRMCTTNPIAVDSAGKGIESGILLGPPQITTSMCGRATTNGPDAAWQNCTRRVALPTVTTGAAKCDSKVALATATSTQTLSTVTPGQEFFYRVRVSSTEVSSGMVSLADTLPTQVEHVSSTLDGTAITPVSDGSVRIYKIGTFTKGQVKTLLIKVKVIATAAPGSLANSAVVTTVGGTTPSTCTNTLTIPAQGSASCTNKQMYTVVAGQPGTVIADGSQLAVGTEIFYQVNLNALSLTSAGVTVTDTLPAGLDLVAATDFTYDAATRKLTKSLTAFTGAKSLKFRAKVATTATGSVANTAGVVTGTGTPSTCTATFTLPGAVTYSCNASCTTTDQCKTANADYTCSTEQGNRCRLSSNVASETCQPKTYSCNSECSSDSNCQSVNSSYVCSSVDGTKRCRLSSNTSSSSCTTAASPTPTPTPTPPIGCNSTCVNNADCSNPDHICYDNNGSKVCRLATYVESTTCSPPSVASQPSLPAELPQTGPADWSVWVKGGLVVLGLGGMLLLLL